ncbi:MAG: hypothetical protein M3R25_14465, partial [Bacteroidota bacterium]|nr:hypothetical protein [Bacteroidota bacterium]
SHGRQILVRHKFEPLVFSSAIMTQMMSYFIKDNLLKQMLFFKRFAVIIPFDIMPLVPASIFRVTRKEDNFLLFNKLESPDSNCS